MSIHTILSQMEEEFDKEFGARHTELTKRIILFFRSFATRIVEEAQREERERILSLALSATLADHMGDMWDDINKVLEDIDEVELANADHEYEEIEGEESGDGDSEFGRLLRKRGIKTVWGT